LLQVSGVPERAVGPYRPFDDWTEAQVILLIVIIVII
jgi:hypothetical protein